MTLARASLARRQRYLARLADNNPVALQASASLAAEIAREDHAMDEKKITDLAAAIARDCRTLAAIVAHPEPPPREIAPLIVQLADVERETREHYVRFPHGSPRMTGSAYSCEAEAREWHLLCVRKDQIIAALTRYAVAATEPRPVAANDLAVSP